MAELIPSSEDTRIYEVCVLIPYPMNQKEEQETIKSVEALFEEAEAKQISKDVWGRRGLAYKIGGYEEGNYIIYYYDMDPSKLKELDQALRITPNVLRHLIIKPPKGYEVVNYSEAYQEWLKDRAADEERKKQEREDRLKKKMLDKQKRPAKKAEKKEDDQPAAEAPKAEGKEITAEIDKLIADDELEL